MDHTLKQEALPNAISGHDCRNWTALHEAVAAGDDKRVQVLLSSNATDRLARESSQGNTPLHEAASRGLSRCVKLLCAPPTSAKAQPSHGKEKSRLKSRVANTIEALHNSTLSIINNEGLSALHLAAQNGHNQSSRELLMAGADPDVQNKYGDTALHTACRYGHAGVTRILLSALCDPNKTNLNGDTALHITCAMGRRKLTRILLEADARLSVKNAQGDTPQSIAVRKNYREINEILSTPKRIRNRREKPKDNEKTDKALDKDKDKDRDSVDKAINWSPYGCHYFPDPRSFPSPKLETLPKEPLKQGEQYFLDLAGHIHKGPVSVGNTCYCGPFFRHIENKLNCNRKSLKKYVHKTKERLGHKVQALAIKTNDQIEQLTRTMIEDRMRCESKRQYLNEYLRRGEPLRSTFDNQTKCTRIERTLSRCRSLDLLESNFESKQMPNSKSVDILEENQTVVDVVYHGHSKDATAESDSNGDTHSNSSAGGVEDAMATPHSAAQEDSKQSKLDELKLDFLKVSERLGDLLEKTTLIMERDNEQENKLQLCSLSPEQSNPSMHSPENQENKESPNYDGYANGQRRYPNSSETSNPSQNSNSWEFGTTPPDAQKYYHHCIGRGENMLNTVIKALRKDAAFADHNQDDVALNQNADRLCGDKLMYKEQIHEAPSPSCSTDAQQLYPNCHKSMSNLMKRQPLCLEDNFAAHPALFYTNPMGMPQISPVGLQMRQSSNEAAGKVEIKNGEIKYLKKPSTGQVKDMVAQLQGKIDCNQNSDNELALSSEVHNLNYGLRGIEDTPRLPLQNPSALYSSHMRTNPQQLRHIPKDAYFHDLPNRSREPPRVQNIYSADLASARYMRGYGRQPESQSPSAPPTLHLQPNHHHHHHHPQELLPAEYISRNSNLVNGNQPQHLHGNVLPNVSSIRAHPIIFRNPLPHDEADLDVDEIAAVGLYNNVSSLV
ncbi:uncharacterized protein LOC6560055 [Drosophila grimshawi]|uniref:GH21433 n=1 Tax=Drosophila grimshawi TaxID=7222 RepID=B4J9E6_DROGR|nr:uncharacterized protein LOC6560055 [Drosophila grimshawi]XP_043071178.1 uncharacterized protein LOC6560055 [Drosophila grimshawi]EDW01427.1 GH21433 [Drosophila grimshawi]